MDGGILKGQEETFEGDEYVHFLIVRMVSMVYTYAKKKTEKETKR